MLMAFISHKIVFQIPQVVILVAATVLCTLLILLFKKKNGKCADIIMKCLAVLYVVVINFRFFTNDSFLLIINGGYYGVTYYQSSDYLVSILRWGQYMSYTLLPISVFCKNRTIRNVSLYVCLPFALANVVCYSANLPYLLDGAGARFQPDAWLVNALWSAELIIAIVLPLTQRISGIHKFDVKNKKEWIKFGVYTLLLAILLMPSYVPQSLIGIKGIRTVGGMGIGQIVWIVGSAVITMVLYYFFRWKDYDTRYTVCLLLSLMAFNHYNSIAQMTRIAISIIPLQLCNIASVLMLVVMITKSRKLFNFVFLANIVGTIIGMLGANEEGSWCAFWNVRFMYQHTIVLIVPSLMYGLRIFERFSLKDVKDFLVGIGIYWIVCLVSGTLVNTYPDKTGWTANWFYMFDREYATDFLPIFAKIISYNVQLGRFQFFPIFQLLVPVVYSLVCLAFLLLVNWLDKVEDDRLELRENVIKMLERKGKKVSLPRSFID